MCITYFFENDIIMLSALFNVDHIQCVLAKKQQGPSRILAFGMGELEENPHQKISREPSFPEEIVCHWTVSIGTKLPPILRHCELNASWQRSAVLQKSYFQTTNVDVQQGTLTLHQKSYLQTTNGDVQQGTLTLHQKSYFQKTTCGLRGCSAGEAHSPLLCGQFASYYCVTIKISHETLYDVPPSSLSSVFLW